MVLFIISLIILSAVLAVYGKYSRLKIIHYVFKPLTVLLIILLALVHSRSLDPWYQYLVLLALLSSLAGDVFLMLPGKRFIQGLLAFLVAHILYIFAFIRGVETYRPWLAVPIFVLAAVIYSAVYRNLKKLRLPVALYIIIISLMGWAAVNRYFHFTDSKALAVLAGGLLFLFSDSALAINMFRKPFRSAEVLILGTYFSAQLLFALSV